MINERLKIVLGFILICLIWGSTWLFIKIGLDTLTPMFAVGVRFLIASAILLGIMKFKSLTLKTDTESIRLYLVLTFLSYIFPFSFVYWAEQYVPSGLTSVLFAILPFWVIFFSWILLPKEPIGVYKILGSVLGFTGIAFINWDEFSLDFGEFTMCIFLIILAAVMQGASSVFVKKVGGGHHPLSMNFIPMFLTGIILIPAGLLVEDTSKLGYSQNALISILYLASFGTVVSFGVFYWLLKRINVVILSLSTFIIPIIAVLLGWIFLNETLSSKHIIGSSFVLIGILFANFKGFVNYYKERTRRKDVGSY